MSLRACIPGLVADGKISSEKGEEMGQLFDELHQDFKRQFGDQAADAMASDATIREMEARLLRKKRVALGQVQAQQRMLNDMGSFAGRDPGAGGPIDPRAAVALFDRDGRAGYSNVEGRRRAIRARAHAMLAGVLEHHHTDIVGRVRHKAQLDDMVRELFGENSGNAAARELAHAWSTTAEMLRQRFNAAGGAIGRLEKWGLPQAHDTRAVRSAGYETWRDAIAPLLDRQAMVDDRTGLPFSDGAFELALRQVWESIRTDGWNGRSAGTGGRGALANQRSDSRFLRFRDADSWMAYQRDYGVGNAYDAMMGHVDGMARDVALMEVLGPNPAASVRWLTDNLTKTAQLAADPGSGAIDRAHAGTRKIGRLYGEITGANGRPENRTVALAFSAVRSFQTAAKLGSATLSAITDAGFGVATRHFNGLAVRTILPDYIAMLRPGADHALAVRTTGIAEEWSKRAGGQARALGEELTGETARRLAEGVLRVSGLARWTEAGRWAFGMEFLGHVTDQRGTPFENLNPAFQRALQRYGIDSAGWDALRATPLERDGGSDWIKPNNVADHSLGDRLYEMIHSEMDYAVPTPDLTTRATINASAAKGTYWGEIIRSAALFKGFGISVMMMQARRIMEETTAGRGSMALRYAAGLFITTTLLGGMTLQLKALASGKDPRPMADPSFWGAAVLQGGGFGIFGDFLQSTQNRFGGGLTASLAGPIAGDVQELTQAAHSNSPAWTAAKLARQQLPGGSLWYVRLAFDRVVTDQIQQMLDPHYAQSWQRMEKRAHDQRTQSYWKPGQTTPDRLPDFSNALATPAPTPTQ